MLRILLQSGDRATATLGEELALVEAYLEIERARLGSRLRTGSRFPPAVTECRLPAFILQPLVENAITHGIARTLEGGQIALRAQRDAATMSVIDISNFCPAASEPGRSRPTASSLTIPNCRRRLALMYGTAGALRSRFRHTQPFPRFDHPTDGLLSACTADMRRLRVLVVEDEELARERLARLIAERSGSRTGRACGNCDEALGVLVGEPVDLALLDIQMPGISGMEVLGAAARDTASSRRSSSSSRRTSASPSTRSRCMPPTICSSRSTVRSSNRRWRRRTDAIEAREALALAEKIHAVVGESIMRAAGRKPGRRQVASVVRDNGRYLIVRNEQIDWIEADGRECVLHCGNKQHRVDGPLTELAERLCADRFVQVSRSSLLNIDSIAQLQEMFKGDLVAVMKGGHEVPVSRRFRSGSWIGSRAEIYRAASDDHVRHAPSRAHARARVPRCACRPALEAIRNLVAT